MNGYSDACECGKQAYKTNGKGQSICFNKAHTGLCGGFQPITVDKEQPNNEPCNCGSGIKYKKCCKFKK